MRLSTLHLLVALTLSSIAVGQDKSVPAKDDSKATPSITYEISVTEYRLTAPLDPALATADTLQTLERLSKEKIASSQETLRLSALDSHESMVQFSKNVSVNVGTTRTQFGQTQVTQDRTYGTTLIVTPTTKDAKVLLQFRYESSGPQGEAKEDSRPDVELVKVDTTLLLAPNQKTLVVSSTKSQPLFLVVTAAPR